jgi:hypothetical protein
MRGPPNVVARWIALTWRLTVAAPLTMPPVGREARVEASTFGTLSRSEVLPPSIGRKFMRSLLGCGHSDTVTVPF